MQPGLFITFEGIDGTGKTTQINLLKDYFEQHGRTVVLAKEPGDRVPDQAGGLTYIGSRIGYQVRHMMFKDPTTHRMMAGVNDCLFLADHLQLQGEVIQPALFRGDVVLCDRYVDSEYAYATQKATQPWVFEAFREATYIQPHITILLLGDPTRLVERTKRVGTPEEGKQEGKVWAAVDVQRRIQGAYLANLECEGRVIRVRHVETKGIVQIAEEIRRKVEARLQNLDCTSLVEAEVG
jgi:dTMP kinase